MLYLQYGDTSLILIVHLEIDACEPAQGNKPAHYEYEDENG